MKIEVLDDATSVAVRGAEVIAAAAREAVEARGRFVFAISGGRTPWVMLRRLAELDLPWNDVHLFQVDERVAPDGDPERNWTRIESELVRCVRGGTPHVHPMPVLDGDLERAADAYAESLAEIAGRPPVLDLVHLGLGSDGHTASLVPDDAVLEVRDRDVAVTGIYQGRRRMTLTFPVLDRARSVLWLVTGGEKADALAKLCAGDPAIPAGRVLQERALLVADRTSAAGFQVRDSLGLDRLGGPA